MSDIDIVGRVYEACSAQDLEGLFELADGDCVITQDPSLPWGGRHVGHEGIAAFASALVGTIDSAVTTETLLEADGQVIQSVRTWGAVRADGATFDLPEVHTWTVRNGEVVAAHFSIVTSAMLRALGRVS